ncbi:MAG: ATP-binding protein [Prolixibacteraceae bacterium]
MIAIALGLILLINNRKKLIVSQEIRYKFLIIANELRQSSDDLTLYCRMFAMSGDSTWETKYWRILDMRNGKYPRPDGHQIALRDSMIKLGFNKSEFELLEISEAYSNELVLIEKNAFSKSKDIFHENLGAFSIGNNQSIDYTTKLLFDEKYLEAKRKIMEPIDQFLVLINDKTRNNVENYNKMGLLILTTLATFILAVILTLIASYFLVIKKLNEQIKTDIDLKISNENLLEAKDKAEESDRLKTAFLSNMSHEIRTPMNGILGFSALLKEPRLNGELQQEYIRIIEKSGARMLNIINDIVDISKIEAGLMKLKIEKFNINELIEYIYTFFKPETEVKGIKITYQNLLPVKEAIISSDYEKLYAILSNLVKNAIKYTEKGEIELGYLKKDETLEIFVKDTGIGIPKDRQAAIFERFIQADISDKMARQGAGLGLSISKAYVEMLGGKIWLESEEGIGSTFFFTLPNTFGPDERKVVGKIIPAQEEKNQIKKLKILIAEDDETSEMLLSILTKDYSRELLQTSNALEAIEICHNNPDIDLILMDINMPEIGGYEATRQIRQFNQEVIIIAQTAYGLFGDREKSIRAGCDDYISKPIKSEDLKALIMKYFKK